MNSLSEKLRHSLQKTNDFRFSDRPRIKPLLLNSALAFCRVLLLDRDLFFQINPLATNYF
jgi:hypothetical protein